MMDSDRDFRRSNRCARARSNRLDEMNTSASSCHSIRGTSSRPTRSRSKSSSEVSTHQLFILILLQLFSITANAMIYLEDPIEAQLYDSLPDPPDKSTISKGYLFNLTEGGLDAVRFKVGTPLHYLTVQSLDEGSALVTPIISDQLFGEEMINGDDTSLFTNLTDDVDGTNATTTLQYQNETDIITNYTDANETIIISTNETSSTIFDRRTTSILPSWNDAPPASSPISSSSSSIPTLEISGEYTDIVHHNPQALPHNSHNILIANSDGKTLTIKELLGFFNDSKLVFSTDEEYVFYDSRQARFGSDLGPKGNAEFVNIMLPPRWGEEDLMVDLGKEEEGVGTNTNNVTIDNIADVEDSGGYSTTDDDANRENGDNELRSFQDDQLVRLRGLEDEVNTPEFNDDNRTNVTEVEKANDESNQSQTNATEDHQTVTSDTASAANTNDVTLEEFSYEFDTHISSYFCLDDFESWRNKLSGASSPLASTLSSSSSNNNTIYSNRGIVLMVQRGRCSFENKAELAMVFNSLMANEGKSDRIDHIIVYNNGTIDKHNNGTDGEEQLVEMLRVPLWNNTFYENNNPIDVGMLYITTASGRDLLKRMSERQNELGISPYLDISWLRGRHLKSESRAGKTRLSPVVIPMSEPTTGDGEHADSVGEIIGDDVTNGWYFPATLTRFCLSCGKETDYGFYPFSPHEGGDGHHYRPGQFGPTNWPNIFSDDYQPERWVEVIRRLMIATLVLLLVGPVILATHRWHTVGGTVRVTTDENGRRRLRIISPSLEEFVEGVPDIVENNGTKLDRAQVFSLPEIVYRPPSSVSDGDTIANEDGESPLSLTRASGHDDTESRASPDSFQENDNHDQDRITSTTQITPPGSEANDMFASSSCCPICIEEFEPGEKLRVLPRCKHLFHIDCIMPWLTERQGCCPQCRTPVLPEEFQRSRRSSPRRPSSVLQRFRRERAQDREEADSALTPARLFTEIEDDLRGGDATSDAGPQESGDNNVVPYGVEEDEIQFSTAEGLHVSSPEMIEQGLVSEDATGENNVGGNIDINITATVSADDIDVTSSSEADNANIARASDSSDVNRDNGVSDELVGPPSVSRNADDGYKAFLDFLKEPSITDMIEGEDK